MQDLRSESPLHIGRRQDVDLAGAWRGKRGEVATSVLLEVLTGICGIGRTNPTSFYS